MESVTLAGRLGTTAHLSPLLMKARRLGLGAPGDLERLAVKRGLRYYDSHGDLEAAFQQVRIPDVQELRDAFEKALPVVRQILRDSGR